MNAIQQLLTDHIDIWTSTETEKQSRRGRASNNAASVYGIKKLRELILELAVHGKLVPQDASDEPASELLKRIQTEKNKLITEGKIKRDNLPNTIKSIDLPFGWEWTVIQKVVSNDKYSIKRGPFGSSIQKSYFVPSGYKVYEQQHAINDDFSLGNYYLNNEKFAELSAFSVSPNDIIISCSGTVGKVAIAPAWMEPGIINQALLKLTLNEKALTNAYFKILFPAFYMKTDTLSDLKGTAQKNMVSVDELKNEPFPLPPLAEQHRIVAKVSELMALCDQLETQHSDAADAQKQLVRHLLGTLTQSQSAANFNANWHRIAAHFDTLFTTEASIDALKQTLLQLAVMGKLVAQDPNDEPACELVKRIQSEKIKLIAEGKGKKNKPSTEIVDNEKPFKLPNGWAWTRVGQLFGVTSGGSFDISAELESGEFAYVKVGDMNLPGNEIEITTSSRFVNPTEKEIRGIIPINSIIFPKRGGAIATNKKRFITSNVFVDLNIMAITVPQAISVHYTFQWLAGIDLALLNTGTSVPQINHQDIEPLIFPLPPFAEQLRIVVKVDELMTLCEQLKFRITDANQCKKKLADVLVENAVS